MTKLERTIDIDASPEDVYDYLTDPTKLGDGAKIKEALVSAPEPPLSKDDKVKQRMKLAGKKFEVEWDVEVADGQKEVRGAGGGPMGSKATATYEIKSKGNGGTTFSYLNEYDIPGGPLGKVAGKAIVAASGGEADGSLKRLKANIEKG